jgi:hypothetical protein
LRRLGELETELALLRCELTRSEEARRSLEAALAGQPQQPPADAHRAALEVAPAPAPRTSRSLGRRMLLLWRRRLDVALVRKSGLIDDDWYRAAHGSPDRQTDVAAHYVRSGAAQGETPHPLFDTRWYLQQYPDVAASGRNPLAHYLQLGVAEGRDPGPQFSTTRYLAVYPDVADQGLNPLLHYVKHGQSEGRTALPQG